MQIEIVKGFRDILPLESLKRQKIKEIIEKKYFIDSFKGVFVEKKYDIDINSVKKLKALVS